MIMPTPSRYLHWAGSGLYFGQKPIGPCSGQRKILISGPCRPLTEDRKTGAFTITRESRLSRDKKMLPMIMVKVQNYHVDRRCYISLFRNTVPATFQSSSSSIEGIPKESDHLSNEAPFTSD